MREAAMEWRDRARERVRGGSFTGVALIVAAVVAVVVGFFLLRNTWPG
jgi:hypothetical protein